MEYNKNYKTLLDYLNNNKCKCPECNCESIGIDNWGIFNGINDWFYYCKKCDYTFVPNTLEDYYKGKVTLGGNE